MRLFKTIIKLNLLMAFLVTTINISAQGPPIFTDTPIMLGLEGKGLRTFGNIVSKENANAYIQPVVELQYKSRDILGSFFFIYRNCIFNLVGS